VEEGQGVGTAIVCTRTGRKRERVIEDEGESDCGWPSEWAKYQVNMTLVLSHLILTLLCCCALKRLIQEP
jgi:hypothetical protein